MKDKADLAAKAAQGDILNIHAVYPDSAGVCIIKAGDHINNGAFAGAGTSYDTYGLSRHGLEADIT